MLHAADLPTQRALMHDLPVLPKQSNPQLCSPRASAGMCGGIRAHVEMELSETGIVTYAMKVRLEAEAYLPGTDGSNPFPSSAASPLRTRLPGARMILNALVSKARRCAIAC
jgi:hypothetical protein